MTSTATGGTGEGTPTMTIGELAEITGLSVSAIRFYQQNNIPIFNMVTAGHFEGGDFCILEPGAVLVGYCGERSEEAGARQVAGWMAEIRGWDQARQEAELARYGENVG